jgi:hypothetical protein
MTASETPSLSENDEVAPEDTLKDQAQVLADLSNLLITPLKKHKVRKGIAHAPFEPIRDKVTLTSWKDDFLPLVTWAAAVTACFDRETYLAIFRDILERIRHLYETEGSNISVDHLSFKDLSNTNFDFVLEPVLSRSSYNDAVVAMASLKSLPDQHHWKRHLVADTSFDLTSLAGGYANCFDHQSQEARTFVGYLL